MRKRLKDLFSDGCDPDAGFHVHHPLCGAHFRGGNCGNTFVTGSTKENIHVEICSKCHPFYTGQQKATQARGRVDKFNKKYGIK